jgi:5-(carboxyamino)imidazole ribonucleotide synthase
MNIRELFGLPIKIIGDGQLGRMLAESAKKRLLLTNKIYAYGPSPKGHSPSQHFLDAPHITGKLDDFDAVMNFLSSGENGVGTIEVEHIALEALAAAEQEGQIIFPSNDTLLQVRNKLDQAKTMKRLGIPIPHYEEVSSVNQLKGIVDERGVMLKKTIGSYDGKGNLKVNRRELDGLEGRLSKNNFRIGEFMAQDLVNFERELSVIVARDTHGNIVCYEPGINIHTQDYVLDRTLVLPEEFGGLDEKTKETAIDYAKKIIEGVNGVGVMGIEMFQTSDGEILINEVAPRVHNSGHWTMTCGYSQFDQHMLAITGRYVSSEFKSGPSIMLNVLGDSCYGDIGEVLVDKRYNEEGRVIRVDESKLPSGVEGSLHMYAKGNKFEPGMSGRKVGHLNLVAQNAQGVRELQEMYKNANVRDFLTS